MNTPNKRPGYIMIPLAGTVQRLQSDGLLLGMQVVGRPFDEATVFKTTYAYGRYFRGALLGAISQQQRLHVLAMSAISWEPNKIHHSMRFR